MFKVSFPEVRSIFRPDPGFMLFDIDLEGADAQTVAWEANDISMKEVFRRRQKIHAHNALTIWGPEIAGLDGKREPYYTRAKQACHATNFGAWPPTLAAKCGMTIGEAEEFHHQWLRVLHPGIGEWHDRTQFELQTTGRTTNKFGYHIDWFQRPDGLLPEALAWTPQSTTAHVTEEAMIRIFEAKLDLQLLMQCHDSLIFQVKLDRIKPVMAEVYFLLHTIVVPYDDPLIIPWGIKQSRISWGQGKNTTWEEVIGDEFTAIDQKVRELVGNLHGLHHGHGGSTGVPHVGGAMHSSRSSAA